MTDSIRLYIATVSTLGKGDDDLVDRDGSDSHTGSIKGNDDLISRTELETHANMAVVGRNVYIYYHIQE